MLFPLVGVIDLPFQGFETETRDLLGGTKENVVYPSKGSICPLGKSMILFTKRKQRKLSYWPDLPLLFPLPLFSSSVLLLVGPPSSSEGFSETAADDASSSSSSSSDPEPPSPSELELTLTRFLRRFRFLDGSQQSQK